MKFENTFDVDAPADTVWATLMDIERVTPCMPGAQVLASSPEGPFKVSIKVKVGPISMTYRGEVEIEERDDAARQATLHVKAKEARGQGSADAHVRMAMSEESDPTRTRARMNTEVQLTGKAASMGRGVIGDVAERLVQTFAGNLAEMVGAGGETSSESQREPIAEGADDPAPPPPPTSASPPPPPPPTSASPPPPPPPPRPAEASDSLPAGEIAASVIAGRLAEPRTLLLATAAVAGAGVLLGYVIGSRRR